MSVPNRIYKVVYCTPGLYMAGGMERVLTVKANYFAEHFGYDITIIITEGKGQPFFYPLSDKIKVVNLNIGFEELWNQPFFKKILIYLKKQHHYKKLLTEQLMQIRPDITISLLRREINFLTSIKDGSKKIGEIHINRAHYRTFEENDNNFVKTLFSKMWMNVLIGKLRRLDRFVVLTEPDRKAWKELERVEVIPNPLSFSTEKYSQQKNKRIIAVGRYCYEKGYDHLLKAWSIVQNSFDDWRLDVYGDGDRTSYDRMIDEYKIDRERCSLNERISDVQSAFADSSFAVCSSRFEGFGLTIIEAMACGLPVVSFDCPWGPRSIISNGEDGILVKNGNVKKLAESMMNMIKNSETRVLMGKNAMNNVQRFGVDAVANKWRELFENL